LENFNCALHRFAVFLAASTLVLIFVGGLVTSTDSGLAVPDWPLSYGQLFPRMVGGVLYEHGHRMVAATVGLLAVILAVWLWRRDPRKWVRVLGGLALLAVVGQGVLGGITVLFLLPVAVSVSHAALAQIFFCLTVALATFTSRAWHEAGAQLEDRGAPSLRLLSRLTTAVVYLQILIGALMRHTASGMAIPDFPLSYGRLIPPYFTRPILINFAHRVGALVVAVMVIWLATQVLRRHAMEPLLRRPAWALLIALAVQIFLGAETVWSGRGVIFTTLHVAAGAFTLATSLYLTLMTHRVIRPQPAARPAVAAQPGVAME